MKSFLDPYIPYLAIAYGLFWIAFISYTTHLKNKLDRLEEENKRRRYEHHHHHEHHNHRDGKGRGKGRHRKDPEPLLGVAYPKHSKKRHNHGD